MLVQAVTKSPLISNEQKNSHTVHERAILGQFHAILPRTAGSDDGHAPVWLQRAKMSYEAHGCSHGLSPMMFVVSIFVLSGTAPITSYT